MKPLPTTRTIKRTAWAAGYTGVVGLAKAIGRSRETVYQALENPQSYGPTIRAIEKALGLNKRD